VTVVLSEPAPGSGTGWHCLTVIYRCALVPCERLHGSVLCSVMLLFGLQNLCVWKKVGN